MLGDLWDWEESGVTLQMSARRHRLAPDAGEADFECDVAAD